MPSSIFGLFPSNCLLCIVFLQVGKYHVSKPGEAESMAEKAVRYIERALEADNQNFACHKWSGIIISWSSEFAGTRRKIERSFDVRDHFQVQLLCSHAHMLCVNSVKSACTSVKHAVHVKRN